MKRNIRTIVVTTTFIPSVILAQDSLAKEHSNWFIKPNIGISLISNLSANVRDINNTNGKIDIDTDSGFVAGLGAGYRYNKNLAVEVAWEYRSNDSAARLSNDSIYEEGDYASNAFFINGIYTFSSSGRWKPYLGVGLAWIQEVDIDIETAGSELSYSASGDVGYQAFGGVDYRLNKHWNLQAEVRTGSVSGIALDAETNSTGSFSDLDYKPTTFQLGMVYNF